MKKIKCLSIVALTLGFLMCFGQNVMAQNARLKAKEMLSQQRNMPQAVIEARQNAPKKQIDKSTLSQVKAKKAKGIVNRESAKQGEKKLPKAEKKELKGRINPKAKAKVAAMKNRPSNKAKFDTRKAEFLKKVESIKRNRIQRNQKQSKS